MFYPFAGKCFLSVALPNALRARFKAYIEDDLSGRAAAARLRLSAATGVRLQLNLRETGSVAMEARGLPPGHGKLAAHQAFLEEMVAQDGDITLPELSGALKAATGVVAHAASIMVASNE
ncbi:transposase [Oceaniovalibus sp. ACAM 378]|uniref:transposase n=1 Tax=Oceaniovalibus sp. ACAM 378 TaxID=2599923 RepID=UPI0011D8079A|nr:transposase [Oceaniovalibus sp. ACAM 378]TYB83396.1 transposase [Oceaniovalibus sp. ACAM 378]